MDKDSLFGLNTDQLERLFDVCAEGAHAESECSANATPSHSVRTGSPGELLTAQVGTRIGHYRLLGVLGEGGMGIVYLAEQEHPIKRHVALKIIKPGMDSARVITRFETERQALARLDHPNVARVYDAGTTEQGRPYFAMEHVEGLSITDYCDQHTLSIEERLRLFIMVCQAIHHAHQRGFIHRDIKPSNILITLQDGQAIPKVIDFGVARALSQPLTHDTLLTQPGQWIGTPEYMSPEQIDQTDETADTRSDVYALGALLYVLITGVLPFDSDTLRKAGSEHLRKVIREQAPKTPNTCLSDLGDKASEVALKRRTNVHTLAKCLQNELEWIPLKAMRKERERRYQSAAELAQDVQNYLCGTPLMAGPLRTSYRIRKFVKRNRILVSAAAVVMSTISIGLIVGMSMHIRTQVQAGQLRTFRNLINNDIIPALSPFRAQGGEITALSVLDAIAHKLEGEFKVNALAEAEIRYELGKTYEWHDDHQPALEHLQLALNIFRRELGNDHPKTANCVFRLGQAYHYQGRLDEAERLLLETVAYRTQRFGKTTNNTLDAMIRVANNHVLMGEYERAMQISREVQSLAGRGEGDTQFSSVLAMVIIGGTYRELGEYQEAETWLSRALKQVSHAKVENTSWRAEFTDELGFNYLLQGRYVEAESLLKEAHARALRVFGAHHGETHAVLENLIRLKMARGNIHAAKDLYTELQRARIQWATERGLEEETKRKPVSLSGHMHYDEQTDTYTVVGCGMDIWHVLDEFHFANKELEGDGTITARIDSLDCVDQMTKAGIMIRSTLDPTSKHASVYLRSGGVIEFRHRASQCGAALSRSTCIRNLERPHWLRLERHGHRFTAYHGRDGIHWQEVGVHGTDQPGPVEIAMDDTVHIGLIVTSEDPGRTAETEISHVSTTGEATPEGPLMASQDISILNTGPP
jgi:eukaryotic-like serine/threonine-protein kinase